MSPRALLARATPVAWLLCSLPGLDLALRAWQGRLTANPIEFVTLRTGYWALLLLIATLAITPLRRITGLNELARYRRGIGLFAFLYASMHVLTYVALDRFFEFGEIGADILKRPYITVGFLSFLLLVPLALTSSRGSIRRLGRNWQRLHRLIYPAAALAVLHFYWKRASKADIGEPLVFAGILGLLLVIRLYRRRARPQAPVEKRPPTATRT